MSYMWRVKDLFRKKYKLWGKRVILTKPTTEWSAYHGRWRCLKCVEAKWDDATAEWLGKPRALHQTVSNMLYRAMQRACGNRRHGRCPLLPKCYLWFWKATGVWLEEPRALDATAQKCAESQNMQRASDVFTTGVALCRVVRISTGTRDFWWIFWDNQHMGDKWTIGMVGRWSIAIGWVTHKHLALYIRRNEREKKAFWVYFPCFCREKERREKVELRSSWIESDGK